VNAAIPLLFAALLFCIGVYGVLSRRNAVMVLMSVELMLAAVTINLVAFGAIAPFVERPHVGQIFALFVLAVGAAEVGIGLAIVLLLYRNRASVNIDDADLMKY
jgi:NADH:ubiquinone oxidoreductase subunit K